MMESKFNLVENNGEVRVESVFVDLKVTRDRRVWIRKFEIKELNKVSEKDKERLISTGDKFALLKKSTYNSIGAKLPKGLSSREKKVILTETYHDVIQRSDFENVIKQRIEEMKRKEEENTVEVNEDEDDAEEEYDDDESSHSQDKKKGKSRGDK